MTHFSIINQIKELEEKGDLCHMRQMKLEEKK